MGIREIALAGIAALGINACVTCEDTNLKVQQTIIEQPKSPEYPLEELAKSVVCVRLTVQYEAARPNAKGTAETKMSGTGFVFDYDGRYSYIITAEHVVDISHTLKGMAKCGKKGTPCTSMFLPVAAEYSVVDNREDNDSSNDISLELIAADVEHDIAILRTETELPVAHSYYVGNAESLHIGEDAYSIGYPAGEMRLVVSGIVSNTDNNINGLKDRKVLNLSMDSGQSGSPYFVKRGDKYYLMGICQATFRVQGRSFAAGICTDIEDIIVFMNNAKYVK